MLVDYMLFSLHQTAARLTVTERCFCLRLTDDMPWCLLFSIYDCKVTAKLSLVKSFCAKFSKQLVDLTIIVAKYKRQPQTGKVWAFICLKIQPLTIWGLKNNWTCSYIVT